ncbi:MAG: hypothetical protein ACK41C_02620 [Phenylobacterium sp.]|uniref:hypothetical protein n=1 Tax=Phenylobacterium sp. TaxID=1871053 RepID=UPI00391C50CF
MQAYRVYRLNPAGKITSGEWIEAANEDDARAAAHAMCDPATPKVELWRGAMRVAVLPCEGGEAA